MTTTHGAFVWHELMTSDTAAAMKFYGSVAGWTAQASDVPGMDYWMLKAAEVPVCGLMDVPADAKAHGARPMWVGYVGVDDVDVWTDKALKHGGRIYRPPHDIANVGRFSIIGDPEGTMLALFKFATPMPSDPAAQSKAGHIGWNELYAADWKKAFTFYEAMFGWKKDQAVDMGPMGTYQLFAHGEVAIGGMMDKPPHLPATAWTYYINVSSVDGAIDRIKVGGGQITHGPVEVPGGSWIAQGLDPQGAMFAVVGPKA